MVARQRLRSELGAAALPRLDRLVKTGLVVACQQTAPARTTIKWTQELRLNMSHSELNELLATWRGK